MPGALTFVLLSLAAQPLDERPGFDRATYTQYALAHPGDAAGGRALFADLLGPACARCHRAQGKGGDIGPDLSDIGAKYGREHLIESVLEPSRQIVEGYRPIVVAMHDGRLVTGLVKNETTDLLTLVDLEGRLHPLGKPEIEARKLVDTSLMPEGLADRLTPAQFADLIAYLESLRSSAQPTPGSGVKGHIVLPPGFTQAVVATGFTGATALELAPDGRVFVCEQTGTVRVVKHDVLLPEPFCTLPVDSQWERGLIGVAVDPEFETNSYVYVNYVAAQPYPHHRLSRFTARGDVAAAGSERILLEGDDQRTLGGSIPAGHQGGAIHFGGDGKLYVAIGDQTAGQPAQQLTSFQGKMLRINADGSIPDDNPFFHSARGKYRAIWALGLRNPFSFAVQPGTGRILINDVGGVQEEVNEGAAGANYGWPAIEHGPTPDPRFRSPIHWYPTASIAGGAFCPMSARAPARALAPFPTHYGGRYFFMDFVKGWIHVLDPAQPNEVTTFASGLARPVDLRFAPDGSLYVLLRDAWVIDEKFQPHTGSLHRIRHATSR